MPIPSLFKRKSSGAKASKKPVVDELKEAFSGDDNLLQLHAETAELLRLVKTPASIPKVRSPVSKRQSTTGSPVKRPVRQTIEVLEDDDDDVQPPPTAKTGESDRRATATALDQADGIDPFAFSAEELRVRKASDTFVPDTSPSKREVGRQLYHFSEEQRRLQRIEQRQLAQAARHEYEAESRLVVNRGEDSAIKIQAHSRGFLSRKHTEEERKKDNEEQELERRRQEAAHWHEVRDVERNEVWYYNSLSGQSQWERPSFMEPSQSSTPELPTNQPSTSKSLALPTLLPRIASSSDLPPVSQSTSRPNSSSNSNSRPTSSSAKTTRLLPSLGAPFDYTAPPATSPWECDSVATSDQSSLCSERLEDDEATDFSRGRRSSLNVDEEVQQHLEFEDDWQTNQSLFLADGSKNSKLRDTIRHALQTSKFDSVTSLVASNVILRKKPTPTKQRQQNTDALSNQRQPRGREIVLGRRDAPMFVAVIDRNAPPQSPATIKTKKTPTKRRPHALPIGTDPSNPLASTPQIRELTDPGLANDNHSATPTFRPVSPTNKNDGASSPSSKSKPVCFNCWSSSTGHHCDVHVDPLASRKIKSTESALLCSNWDLDQLRRKYRAEEIQEIFMKQCASLRYDKRLKQYVTVIEARHPIYRRVEGLATAWSKTMRRKLHTRAWFRSFIEQLRAGAVPKADSTTPKLMKLKTAMQNNYWCLQYSETVREFHPKAPVTTKNFGGGAPIPDVIMVDPARPQLRYWILKAEHTNPVELYKPRKYELPPRRCVPMPTPSFVDEIPLPVPNIYIDSGHIASWLERQSSRIGTAAIAKALLQIHACTPPRGATDARRTKHVTPVTVMFATFGRKPTHGMLAVGGLSAELLIHMLVTTYIPAQYGHFIVFDRRAIAPFLTKDYDAKFQCLNIDAKTMEYLLRPLEHALNVRRPPCIVLATRFLMGETETEASQRFPVNRPEQTGEELANGFRTFWLVDAFAVPDEVDCVTVQPTADVLSPNTTSLNPTVTTKADRFYPFCIPTTKENTPIEFIHLLWIGQSSLNQPQTFTTLGAQQPGEFMRNSNPDGALGVCTSVIYRSWAYLQSAAFDEFTTDEGVAYWYNKESGETYWSRPLLPIEKHRGEDGDVDGVVAHGHGEVATLGVGVDAARYPQREVRKYMTKKMEPPEQKEKRIKNVAASAKKHELVVSLNDETTKKNSKHDAQRGLVKVEVPKLEFKKKGTANAPVGSVSPAKKVAPVASSPQKSQQHSQQPSVGVDPSTQQLIATITQALGSAGTSSGVDMLQLGIGLGMGLGLRQHQAQPQVLRSSMSSRSQRSRPRSAESQVSFADEIEEGEEEEGGADDGDSTARSDFTISTETTMMTDRSVMSTATSVDVGLSPDEVEMLPEAERAGYNAKTPGFRTHPPPGEGRTWVDQPINSSTESQTAVEGFGGSVHQRVACLPKDFVTAVSSTKTCKMQANYLPVIKNTNEPHSVGIVRPRPALTEWLAAGYSPWSAGRAIFGTQFIKNLMHRPEILAAQKSGTSPSVSGATGAPNASSVQVEKKENVTQAVKEAQQLDTVFSLCRHGKYDELERMITSPDWTLPIDAKDVTGNTLLSIACQNNNKRIAKLCLRRGADLNTQNLNGQTVLHYCHEYGFHDLMDYLLDKGARDDVLNADGLTCYEGLSKEAVDAI